MANYSTVWDIEYKVEAEKNPFNKRMAFNKFMDSVGACDNHYGLTNKDGEATGRWAYWNNLEGYFLEDWGDKQLLSELYDTMDIGDRIIVQYKELEVGNFWAQIGKVVIIKRAEKFELIDCCEDIDMNASDLYEYLEMSAEEVAGVVDCQGITSTDENGKTVDEFLIMNEDDTQTYLKYVDRVEEMNVKVTKLDEKLYYTDKFKDSSSVSYSY